MKPRIKAVNIIVEFNGYIVALSDEDDRQKTPEGVEIWIQKKPANKIRPMASCPDGTLDIYKNCRPYVISMEWDE